MAAAEFFRAAHNVKGGLASREPAAAAPQQSWSEQPTQQAPAPQGGKQCAHGAMVYREGTSAKGPWKAYFCPTPKGTPGQCAAEFQR